MANRYWVGGSGSWFDTSHWSSTSGGAGGASIPTSSDDVFVNASSGSGIIAINISSVSTTPSVRAFSTAGVLGSVFIDKDSPSSLIPINVYGNLTFDNVSTELNAYFSVRSSTVITQLRSLSATPYLRVEMVFNSTSIALATEFRGNTLRANAPGASIDTNGHDVYAASLNVSASASADISGSEINVNSFSGSGVISTSSGTVINFSNGAYFNGGSGNSYPSVKFQGSATIASSCAVTSLELSAGTVTFTAGITIAIGTLIANGSSSSQIVMRSSVSGTRFTLSKATGTVDAFYLDLKDSAATGGATWNANNSNNSGNNTGWIFVGPTVPVANFSATPLSGRAPLAVSFTDLSIGVPDTWLWNFGDGTASTLQNPTKTYSAPGIYSVSLYASNSLGGDTETKTSYITATTTVILPTSIASAEAFGTPTVQPGTTLVPLDSIPSAEAFGLPSLSMTVPGVGDIPSAEAFGTPTIITGVKNLFPDSIPSAEAFGTPTVVPGPVSILPPSIAAGEAFGTATILPGPVSVTGAGGIATEEAFGEPTITQTPPPPPPPTDWEAIGREDEKTYIYRVYDSDGNFIGIWTDVKDDLMFTQQINTPGTTTTVLLSRSPNTTKEVRADLNAENGDILTTEDGFTFSVTYETNNSVGASTDVDINYNVDVYVHYGQFDPLITQLGDFLVTEDGDNLMATSGSPNGRRVFSGFILDYESLYGEETGVTVTLVSNGAELSQALIRSGETVVVPYSSQEIATTVKSILDTNPGVMSYDAESIIDTGVSVPARFMLNDKLEGIETMFDQTPDNFYWYGDVATNLVNIKPRSTTPDHTFVMGTHIKSMALKRSQEQMRNLVYFVGEQNATTGISILKKYEDATSQSNWRVGLHRITDRRYSVADSMQRRAAKDISRYKDPVFTTNLTISSARYDIESIKLGQMIQVTNIDNFVRDLLLQIVSLSYTPRAVTIQVGEVLDTQHGTIQGISSGLANEQFQSIPNAPS